jgi:hypothetical protein
MGIDAAFASAKFHFELIKKQYLVKLFPQCAKGLGLLPEDQGILKFLNFHFKLYFNILIFFLLKKYIY